MRGMIRVAVVIALGLCVGAQDASSDPQTGAGEAEVVADETPEEPAEEVAGADETEAAAEETPEEPAEEVAGPSSGNTTTVAGFASIAEPSPEPILPYNVSSEVLVSGSFTMSVPPGTDMCASDVREGLISAIAVAASMVAPYTYTPSAIANLTVGGCVPTPAAPTTAPLAVPGAVTTPARRLPDGTPVTSEYSVRTHDASEAAQLQSAQTQNNDPFVQNLQSQLQQNTGIQVTDVVATGMQIMCAVATATVANAASPFCSEGPQIASGAQCSPVCNAGFSPSEAALICSDGDLPGFTCMPSPCTPVSTEHVASPACVEGATIPDGSTCTTVCDAGYSPSQASLPCTSGVISPFTCGADNCAAPASVEWAGQPSCSEGPEIASGAVCTPVCANGYIADHAVLSCVAGVFGPLPTFTCIAHSTTTIQTTTRTAVAQVVNIVEHEAPSSSFSMNTALTILLAFWSVGLAATVVATTVVFCRTRRARTTEYEPLSSAA